MATYTDNKDVDYFAADSIIEALGGDDTIIAINPSSVEMYGGDGNDRLQYGVSPDGSPLNGTVEIHGGAGNDELNDGRGAGTSYLYGDDGDDILESDGSSGPSFLYGGAGNDELTGGSGYGLIDRITGKASAGASFLYGGKGNDVLYSGHDKLYGNSNSDKLDGGKGKDTFYFYQVVDGATILDFSQVDTIDLGSIDANTKKKGSQNFDFIGNDGFHKKAGELKFGKDKLRADTNGDGRADIVIEVKGDKVTDSDLNL